MNWNPEHLLKPYKGESILLSTSENILSFTDFSQQAETCYNAYQLYVCKIKDNYTYHTRRNRCVQGKGRESASGFREASVIKVLM